MIRNRSTLVPQCAVTTARAGQRNLGGYLILSATFAFAITSFAFVSIGNVMAADETDCNNPTTQTDLNICAGNVYQVTDKKLNTIYRRLMLKAEGNDKNYLRTAERAWVAYRDAECKYESSGSEGGSIYSMEYAGCLTKKTVAHTKELESLTNCLEYDLSCKIRK